MAKDRYKNFNEMIVKEFGEETLVKRYEEGIPSISTGSLGLDISIGIGGIPMGRITEVYGPEGGGKTTLCLSVMRQALKKGLKCLYIDVENSLDFAYVTDIIGDEFDEDVVTIVQPKLGEEAFELAEAGIESGFDLIFFDSVASIAPEEEIKKDFDDGTMMITPRMVAKFLRRNTATINKKEIAFVFTNQVRANIGSFVGGYTTPGGNALKHYVAVRIYISRSKKITNTDDERIGHFVNFVIKKNKVGTPYRQATTNIIYGKGIDYYRDVISFGSLLGVIKSRGSYFGFEDDTIGSKPGIANTAQYLKENQETLDKIVEACYNVSGSKKNHINQEDNDDDVEE